MTFLRFLRRLTAAFFRWWWAALTGVATVLSWLGLPSAGITVPRPLIVLGIFIALALTFLVVTVTAQSYEWFLSDAMNPKVLRVVQGSGGKPVFVLRSEGRPLLAGHILAVHRDVGGAEICMAVLRCDKSRHDGEGDQCEAIWISPGHRNDLARGKVAVSGLHIRRDIPAEAIDQIVKAAT
jgi:hypothetical protein